MHHTMPTYSKTCMLVSLQVSHGKLFEVGYSWHTMIVQYVKYIHVCKVICSWKVIQFAILASYIKSILLAILYNLNVQKFKKFLARSLVLYKSSIVVNYCWNYKLFHSHPVYTSSVLDVAKLSQLTIYAMANLGTIYQTGSLVLAIILNATS